jgi:hypothetical protein
MGFGAYIALTTSMHAVAAAFGATLPFAAYTTATSALSFLTGPFLLLPVLGITLLKMRKAARISDARLLLPYVLVALASSPAEQAA